MQHLATRIAMLCGIILTGAAARASAAPTAPPAAPATQEASPAGMADLQKLLDSGKYNDVLREVARILPARGAAANYDRYEVLMLKAEAHLRLAQPAAASTTYNDAAEEADRQHLLEKAAQARAMQLLLKRSRNGEFTPRSRRGGPAEALNIADPAARKKALEALYIDERAAVEPKLAAGTKARSLPPLADALDALRPLGGLELAATGADEKTKATQKELGDRGRKLIGDALLKAEKSVNQINRAANETFRDRIVVYNAVGGSRVENRTRYRGLKQQDTKDLKGIIDLVPKIAKSAQELEVALGGEATDAADTVQKAADIHALAKKTLETDYAN